MRRYRAEDSMTNTKQPKEIFDAAEYFNRLHGNQEKENFKESSPKEPSIKISFYDKYQGLCRSKLYQSDFNKYIEKRGNERDGIISGHGSFPASGIVKLSDAAKWLCNKWGIKYPINPEVRPVRESELSESKLQDKTFLYSIIDPPITFLTPPKKWQEMESRGSNDTNDIEFTHVDGKFVLMINPSYSYHELEKAFNTFLRNWVEPAKKRRRSDNVDKWQIYDEHIEHEKLLLEITHNLFKTESIPPYEDKNIDAYYHQVQRAQKKAHAIIQHLEDQAESDPTK